MKVYVEELIEQGYAHVPCHGSARVQMLLACFNAILERYDVEQLKQLVYEREQRPDGKYEPDDGFIFSKGEVVGVRAKDTKCRYHYRLDTEARFLYTAQLVGGNGLHDDLSVLLRVCRDVFCIQRDFVIGLMNEIEKQYPALESFTRDVILTMFQPKPTSYPLLRLLGYNDPVTLSQASPHIDRSALSMVSSEKGGSFYMQESKDAPKQILTLQPDCALLFFGEKAAIATKDCAVKLKPLIHGSLNELGERRTAAVSFWHTHHELWDSRPV